MQLAVVVVVVVGVAVLETANVVDVPLVVVTVAGGFVDIVVVVVIVVVVAATEGFVVVLVVDLGVACVDARPQDGHGGLNDHCNSQPVPIV